MKRRSLILAALLSAGAVAPAPAQDPVALAPGSPLLHVTRAPTRTDTFTIKNFREGKLWRSSDMIRTIDRVQEGDRALIRWSQTYTTPMGVTVDTTWVDAQTLAPVRYFADVYGEVQKLEFQGQHIRGTVAPKDSAVRDVNETGAKPFFNAVALDLLNYVMDIGPDFNMLVTAYNPPRAAIDVQLRYLGRDSVTLTGGGTAEAIKIAFGDRGTEIWFDAKDGTLLMQRFASGGNAFLKARANVDTSEFEKRVTGGS